MPGHSSITSNVYTQYQCAWPSFLIGLAFPFHPSLPSSVTVIVSVTVKLCQLQVHVHSMSMTATVHQLLESSITGCAVHQTFLSDEQNQSSLTYMYMYLDFCPQDDWGKSDENISRTYSKKKTVHSLSLPLQSELLYISAQWVLFCIIQLAILSHK